MGRRADPDRELSAEEPAAAATISVFRVRWKRVDPSLGGDGTDPGGVALARVGFAAVDLLFAALFRAAWRRTRPAPAPALFP